MIFSMIGNWFTSTMALFFVGFLDTIAYTLLVTAYNIFYAVAHLDLFGGGTAGETLYKEITSKFYTILSIVMIFVFAYQLIMLIVDPDGKEKKSQSALIKDTIISLILVIILPTIFRYMSLFQYHVLEDNTIAAIIMRTGNGDTDQNPGKKVALMVLMSFYHPEGTTYDTFYSTEGLKSDTREYENLDINVSSGTYTEAVIQCFEESAAYSNSIGSDGDADVNTCQHYYDALNKWEGADDIAVGSITTNGKLHDVVGDQMEYMWILSTAGAVVCAWFFFSYAIDLGTRAVKLGVLQLISPIPVILRIFPQTKKTFETWFGEIKKTYLELFIRVAVIFFILELIILIPIFIQILMEANDALTGIAKGLATVALILGMLKFAKDAPELFKTLFSNGGNLLSGLNFKPGARKRIEDNTYAMKGIGAGLGAVGGAANRFAAQYKQSMHDSNQNAGNNDKISRRLKALGSAALATPRGIVSGGRNGFKNSSDSLRLNGIKQNLDAGVRGAQDSYRASIIKKNNKKTVEDRYTDLTEGWTDFKNYITSSTGSSNVIQANATTISNGISDMKKLAETATKGKVDEKTKLEARLANAVDNTAIIANLEAQRAMVEKNNSELRQKINNTQTAQNVVKSMTEHKNKVDAKAMQLVQAMSSETDLGKVEQMKIELQKLKKESNNLKVSIDNETSKYGLNNANVVTELQQQITSNNDKIVSINNEIQLKQNDPNSREKIKEQIDAVKTEIREKQTEVYNQKIEERAKMGSAIRDLVYSTGFSDSVMNELNEKVNKECGQTLNELLNAFSDTNKENKITSQQTKAMHDIADIIKQAGTDAGLMESLKQSQASKGNKSGSDSKGDKK